MAERGLYSYDALNNNGFPSPYLMVARPTCGLQLDQLDPKIQGILKLLMLPTVVFDKNELIPVDNL